jgi:hypothetical protein
MGFPVGFALVNKRPARTRNALARKGTPLRVE